MTLTEGGDTSAHNRALLKYRRKETLIKKIKELSELCDMNLNLLIEDKRHNKVVQYYAGEQIMIENIIQRMHDADNRETDKKGKTSGLTIQSIDVF